MLPLLECRMHLALHATSLSRFANYASLYVWASSSARLYRKQFITNKIKYFAALQRTDGGQENLQILLVIRGQFAQKLFDRNPFIYHPVVSSFTDLKPVGE